MLYVDYKFEMNQAGLTFTDVDSKLEPNCLLKINQTPFNIGDTFLLTTNSEGCLFFKKVDILIDGAEVKCSSCAEKELQLELPIDLPMYQVGI